MGDEDEVVVAEDDLDLGARGRPGAGRGEIPALAQGLLRGLMLAARDPAGPAWLAASGDAPDIAAFTALDATPVLPPPADLDEIIARVLWARFPRTAAVTAPAPATTATGNQRPPRRAAGKNGMAAGPVGAAWSGCPPGSTSAPPGRPAAR